MWPTLREVVLYGLVGGTALATDWATMVGLSIMGLPIAAANVVGRIAGGLVGFALNGRHTFPGGNLPTGAQLVRFWVVWLALTALTTAAVAGLAHVDLRWLGLDAGLATAAAGKPVVDGFSAVLAFLLSKYWIYR